MSLSNSVDPIFVPQNAVNSLDARKRQLFVEKAAKDVANQCLSYYHDSQVHSTGIGDGVKVQQDSTEIGC